MILASGDPLNFVLATIWTILLLSCVCLAWYAYIRWKKNPDDSLSYNIAVWLRLHKERLFIGFILGLMVGLVFGFIIGIFTGHWFWPVEL